MHKFRCSEQETLPYRASSFSLILKIICWFSNSKEHVLHVKYLNHVRPHPYGDDAGQFI